MTSLDADTGEGRARPAAHSLEIEEPLTPEVVPGPLSGDPLLLALPTFCVGAIGLGLYLWGYLPPGGILPLMGIVSFLGVGTGAVWAAALGQSAVAGILGTFAGFWLSFPALVLGLAHGWWGIAATDAATVQAAQATFLISFLVMFIAITLTTLRLFLAFTALMVVVDVTVVLVLIGVLANSTVLLKAGGVCVWAFTAIGLYIYASQMSVGTGGKPFDLGRPVVT